jgi:hypothetical protein
MLAVHILVGCLGLASLAVLVYMFFFLNRR